jgi:hypothetical protein
MKKFNSTIAIYFALSIGLSQALIAENLPGTAPQEEQHAVLDSRPLSGEKRVEMEKLRTEELEEIQTEENKQASLKLQKLSRLHHQTALGAGYVPFYFHFIADLGAGNIVKLEDGSEWGVDSRDSHVFRNWRINDTVVISPKVTWLWGSNYNYVMTNKTAGSWVNINPFLGPVSMGPYTQWIVGIDYNMGHIYLTNGSGDRSTWIISSKDMYLFRDWQVNDAIIIGDGDGSIAWWLSSYNHILINVEMNHYVHAKLL